MKETTKTKATLVREDGTTTCCNAYTSISMVDGIEYCKYCYEGTDGRFHQGDLLDA